MIEAIGIKDFQSIDSLAVACGPITVFVGESDSGKSAVVRALYALAFNDYPSDHVRAGSSKRSGDHSIVTVRVDGRTVSASKGKSANTYSLVTPSPMTHQDPDRKEWARVGRDVPEEVASALGWRVVELDDGSKFAPSIQRQFDGPFLLADSPSRVAKVLGSLTNIATLFSAIREGTRLEREQRKAADVAREESDRAGVSLEELLPGVERAAVRAQAALEAQEEAEHLVARLLEVERVADRLTKSNADWVAARERFAAARDAQFGLPDLDADLVMAERLRTLVLSGQDAALRLQRAQADWQSAVEVQRHAQQVLDQFVAEMKVCPVCEREWHS